MDLGSDVSNPFISSRKGVLEAHIKAKHTTFEFQCKDCRFKTNSKNNLETHIKAKHLSGKEYHCGSCRFKTNTEDNLNYHIKSKHTDLFEFQCSMCSFQTTTQHDLDTHKSKHENKKIRCEKCDFVSTTEYQHKKHLEVRHTHTPDCWFWCNAVCRKTFCAFEHPPMRKFNSHKVQDYNYSRTNSTVTRSMHMKIPCRYQEQCQNSKCQFEHFLEPIQVFNQRY